MSTHGRVLSVSRELEDLHVTITTGGILLEVQLPLSAEAPPPGTFVRMHVTPSGVPWIEPLGEAPLLTSEDAARWWRPYAKGTTRMRRLEQRACIQRAIRATLDDSGFLEIQAPLLLRATCPDVHIDSFRVGDRYLTTSTEYQLKRMFAGGFERLYSFTQNFREGDLGTRHNPEFTMLEWARAYETLGTIERDVEAVVGRALDAIAPGATFVEYGGHRIEIRGAPWERLSVREALRLKLGVELDETFSLATMRSEVTRLGLEIPEAYLGNRVDVMTLLLDRIQPQLGMNVPTFLVEWPAFLTTSAPLIPGRPEVAERSELFIAGIEIADGFPFLRDAALQEQLFHAANEEREMQGKPPVALDTRYLDALRGGLPPGAGMALGVDRLVMVLSGEENIRNVLAFAWDEL